VARRRGQIGPGFAARLDGHASRQGDVSRIVGGHAVS
jgi:hypothetical protein